MVLDPGGIIGACENNCSWMVASNKAARRITIKTCVDVLNNQEHGGTMLPPSVLTRATAWIGLETTSGDTTSIPRYIHG